MNGELDYGEQPDRKATAVRPDEIDPSFSQVEFNDGTTETMPTSQAQALPQEPPMAVNGQPPLAPGDLAASDNPVVFGVDTPGVPAPPPPNAPPAMGVPVAPGLVGMFGGAGSPKPQVVEQTPEVGTGAAQVDMGEIVAPAQPGGFGLAGQTESSGVQTTERVEDPSEALARTDDAYDQSAVAQHAQDSAAYDAKAEALQNESIARDNQARALEMQIKQAEAEKAQHERVVQAIEKTPIDEDAFWSDSPGRTAAAWIGLALSGFLQGATRGQNPALNQMVQALNHAQDRYLANQQKTRDSQLRTRERLIGDQTTALASMKLQLSGIVEKRIQLDAQREGMPPPPALETYIQAGAVKRAEAKTAIGQQTTRIASEQVQREMRATPGTGPVTRFDVALRDLGVDREKHQKAMDSGLGDQVAGATKVAKIRDALKKIAASNGGELPAQSTLSWRQLGLAPFMARMGVKNADEQVNTQQLLTQATLAYMESLKSLKGIDANAEREKFEQSINTGVAGSTLGALDAAVERADHAALANASGYAGGNARRYVDLLKAQQNGPEQKPLTSLKQRTGAPPPSEAQTLEQAAGGGAPGPLPHAARALATSTTGSRPGTYQRLRGSKPSGLP